MTISMPSSLPSSLNNICASILLPPGLLRDQDMHFGQQSGLNDELEVINKNIFLDNLLSFIHSFYTFKGSHDKTSAWVLQQ